MYKWPRLKMTSPASVNVKTGSGRSDQAVLVPLGKSSQNPAQFFQVFTFSKSSPLHLESRTHFGLCAMHSYIVPNAHVAVCLPNEQVRVLQVIPNSYVCRLPVSLCPRVGS